jgi:hypothetical protein
MCYRISRGPTKKQKHLPFIILQLESPMQGDLHVGLGEEAIARNLVDDFYFKYFKKINNSYIKIRLQLMRI